MLPDKKSNQWIVVLFIYAGIVFTGLILTRVILGTDIDSRLIFSFLILSFGSAILPTIAGYLGRSMFFRIYVSSNIFGLVYMFVLIVSNRTPGWADLTSIVVYVYLLPVGIILGLLAELIFYVKNRRK